MLNRKRILLIGLMVGFILILVTVGLVYGMQSSPDQKLINNFKVGDESKAINSNSMSIPISDSLIGAYVEVTVDDEHYSTEEVSSENFDISDITLSEGTHIIEVSQSIDSIFGDTTSKTKTMNVTVDTTPPNSEVELIGDYPSITNADQLSLKYRIKGDDVAKVKVAGAVSDIVAGFDERAIDVTLHDGNNDLAFTVIDEHGNEHQTNTSLAVLRDNDPAKIYQYTFSCSNSTLPSLGTTKSTSEYEEKVCVQLGQFYGPLNGTTSAPITGKVEGNINSVSFAGTTLHVNDDLSINQRVPVYVRHGSNSYEVKVVDKAGNVSTYLYSLEWSSDAELEQQSDDEVLDRLDDLESQIQDLE